MLSYIINRILRMIPQLFLISVLAFILIQLPPGDYLTQYILNREASGSDVTQEEIARLKETYGLDKPVYQQYLKWIGNIVTKLDFGYSFQWSRKVSDVIGPRIGMTFFIALFAHLITWACGYPGGDLHCRQAVLDGRLCFHFHRLYWPGNPGLPAGPGADVYRLYQVWRTSWGVVLSRIHDPSPGAGLSSSICSSTSGCRC